METDCGRVSGLSGSPTGCPVTHGSMHPTGCVETAPPLDEQRGHVARSSKKAAQPITYFIRRKNDEKRNHRKEAGHDPDLRGKRSGDPVTVIEAGPCAITQKKTVETDGYNAVQARV